MGARWMQQKLQKQKKMRRAHLKGYTLHMSNSKPPNKEVIKEYQERAATLNVTVERTAYLNTRFSNALKNNQGRVEALHLAEILREERLAIEVVERCVEVYKTERRALHLYFGKGQRVAYFVERDFVLKRFRRSEEFRDAHAARTRYQMGVKCIRWQDYQELPE